MPMATLDRAATVHFFHPLRRWSSPQPGARIPVLMYHSVSSEDESNVHPYFRTTTTPQVFATQMQFLADQKYTVLPLHEASERLRTNLPSNGKEVVITFDDGFRDFRTNAFPTLERHGFVASVFLPTDYIGNRQKNFCGKECLDWDEVRELRRAGILFGSHTASHPKLRTMSLEEQVCEVRTSKVAIQDQLGELVDSFSYPYAFPEQDRRFTENFQRILRESGFTHGVSTILGVATAENDPFFIRRLPVSSADDLRFFHAKLDGGYDWLHGLQLDPDLSLIRRVFDGVVNQIHESLTQEPGVPDGMNRRRGSKRKVLLLLVGQHAELIDDASRQRPEVHGLRGQLYLSRIGTREGEKTLDEPREPVHLLQHAADDVAIRAGVNRIPQRHLAHAAHRG